MRILNSKKLLVALCFLMLLQSCEPITITIVCAIIATGVACVDLYLTHYADRQYAVHNNGKVVDLIAVSASDDAAIRSSGKATIRLADGSEHLVRLR